MENNRPSELFSKTDGTRSLPDAVRRAQENLLRLQFPEGYWAGELIVDSTLCSDYVLYMHWDGKVDPVLQEKCVQHILTRQLEEGGWNIYEGGPSELNASVKAYFALKLAGHPAEASHMKDARANILRLGGIPRMNTWAKLYLALLGQFPWRYLPTIPAEMALLPNWFFFNIYRMSSWSRAMLIPLAIINHYKPTRQLPPEKQLHELFPVGTLNNNFTIRADTKLCTWRNFFLGGDRLLKLLDSLPWKPFRTAALTECERWMTERMGEGSDGLAAVFPAMLNSIIALKTLGYSEDHPLLTKAIEDFEGLFVEDPGDFRIQPCLSPVWDTSITAIALTESGIPPDHSALEKARDWMLSKEVRICGDWRKTNGYHEASGWAFEFNNEYYPDTDDTAMVLMALRLLKPRNEAELKAVFHRAVGWQLSFQCSDGGWGAFDVDVTEKWLEDIPFADHNAILDPSCSDLTARTLEMLGYIGFDRNHPAVKHAVTYLKETQDADGSWYGRWGVNYLYGTWQVLRGLQAIGQDMREPWIIRGRNWLESCQNEDGGWGESCESYADPALYKGKGTSTASQTSWGIMGLCACGELERPSIQRGIDYLLRTQNDDGSWSEKEVTGTGFPKVFYLKYDMYRNNFPLLALSTYANLRDGKSPQSFFNYSRSGG